MFPPLPKFNEVFSLDLSSTKSFNPGAATLPAMKISVTQVFGAIRRLATNFSAVLANVNGIIASALHHSSFSITVHISRYLLLIWIFGTAPFVKAVSGLRLLSSIRRLALEPIGHRYLAVSAQPSIRHRKAAAAAPDIRPPSVVAITVP